MSVMVNGRQLRQELARRGLDPSDLARAAQLSAATVSTALSGRPIAARSLARIADVLRRVPVDEVLDRLVTTDSGESEVR